MNSEIVTKISLSELKQAMEDGTLPGDLEAALEKAAEYVERNQTTTRVVIVVEHDDETE